MPHDKIKAATRARMAETGEPYSVACRAVIRAHRSAQIQAAGASISANPVASPIGSALGGAVGQAFKDLDPAAAYRSQIVEISKMTNDLAAAQIRTAVGQAADRLGTGVGQAFKDLDLAAPYRSQIAEISKMMRYRR
jgi:type IV secretory pathway TrbL component